MTRLLSKKMPIWALMLCLNFALSLVGCSSQTLQCGADDDCFLGEVCASGTCTATPQGTSTNTPNTSATDMMNTADISTAVVDQSRPKVDMPITACQCADGLACDPEDPGRCLFVCSEGSPCQDADLRCVDGQCMKEGEPLSGSFDPDPLKIGFEEGFDVLVQAVDGKDILELRFEASGGFQAQGQPKVLDLAVVSESGEVARPEEWTRGLFGALGVADSAQCITSGGLIAEGAMQQVKREIYNVQFPSPSQLKYAVLYDLRCPAAADLVEAWQSNSTYVRETFYKLFANLLLDYTIRATLKKDGSNPLVTKTTFAFE